MKESDNSTRKDSSNELIKLLIKLRNQARVTRILSYQTKLEMNY